MGAKIIGSLLNHELVAMYVLFRDGPKADQTLSFTLNNGDHINVDVDSNGDPIGVEIVYLESNTPDGIFRLYENHEVEKEAIVLRLLSASTRLCMIYSLKKALTHEVNRCLDVIRFSGMYATTGVDTTGDKPKAIHKKAVDESVMACNTAQCCFCKGYIVNQSQHRMIIDKVDMTGGVCENVDQYPNICDDCMVDVRRAIKSLDMSNTPGAGS